MKRVGTSVFASSLAFALLCGVSACGTSEPELPSDESAQGISPAGCIPFAGLLHCSKGAASLRLSPDGGSLGVFNMKTAGQDGVSIGLPEATSFIPDGTYANSATNSTQVANAISDGVTTSTIKAVTTDRGTLYSASFTGNGQATTYSAILSRSGREVARIANIPNGSTGVPPVQPSALGRIWRWIKFHVRIVPASATASATASGACSWEQSFDADAPAKVTLANGQTVEIDNLELLEDVPVGGSYPYTSFDRIDYTSSGGTFTLNGAEIR